MIAVLTLSNIGMNVLDIVNGDDIPTALVLAPIIALLSLVSKKDGRSPRIYIYIGFTDDLTSVRVIVIVID